MKNSFEIWKSFHNYFQQMQCRLDLDEEYRSLYLIDFSITRVKGIHAAVNLGMHITNETDHYKDQEVFLEATQKGVVAKSVYVEVCTDNLDTGVIPVTYYATLAFGFDRRYQNVKTIGLRVFEDSSFHFFDISDNVRRLRKELHDAMHTQQPLLEGQIIAYFNDKGYGFIESDDGKKFFFHIAHIQDENLKHLLPSYQDEKLRVSFQYGGSDGKKYPKAIEVSALPR